MTQLISDDELLEKCVTLLEKPCEMAHRDVQAFARDAARGQMLTTGCSWREALEWLHGKARSIAGGDQPDNTTHN